jgi:hypothetical protein
MASSYTLGDLAKQGGAHHTNKATPNHATRGHMSPIGGGRPDPLIIYRDEDVASAPIQRTRAGTVPAVHRAGGIKAVKGRKPMGAY